MRWLPVLFLWCALSQAEISRYTNAHIFPVARFLNEQIEAGVFDPVSSGKNLFSIPIPGRSEPLAVTLDLPELELRKPGFYARLRLQKLRFRRFAFQFDGNREAVRLRIYFHNQKNGVVGYYRLGPLQRSLHLHVKRVVLDFFLIPQWQEGQIRFAPLDAELSFYEGNIPGFVRASFRQALDEAIQTSLASLQRQFDDHRDELVDALTCCWLKGREIQAFRIEGGLLELTWHSPGFP